MGPGELKPTNKCGNYKEKPDMSVDNEKGSLEWFGQK
jgi:hypothetical protein